MLDKALLKVDFATHESCKFACRKWHYSKSVPVPPLVKIGVWENDVFIGVVIFSRGASSNLLKPYNLKQTEGCELTRVALNKHVTPVTRIIKIAISFLKKKSPNLKLIISFADPQYGHKGTIYQAGNWIYSGRTSPSAEYYYKGKRLHSRQVSSKGYNVQQGKVRKTIRPSQCNVVKTEGKYRYLMPLDKTTKKQVVLLSKEYPKCGESIDGDASGVQPEDGGSSPTSPLHLEESNGD